MALRPRPARAKTKLLCGALLLVALFIVLAVDVTTVHGQTPPPTPPAEETPPTAGGLGNCDNAMRVGVLNDDFNTLPEDLVTRHGNGGFEATVVTNCIPYTINFTVVNNVGTTVYGAEGTRAVRQAFDEIEWLDIGEIEYERHETDVYENGILKFRAGSPVLDANLNAIPIEQDDEAVTAYRYVLEYNNEKVNDPLSSEEKRPLVAEQDYAVVIEVVPFDGAPPEFVHEFTFEVISKIGGQWWDKLLRIATPTYWIESVVNFLTSGTAQGIMGGMCIVTTRTMTEQELLALDRYDSNQDGRITEDDNPVENASDPNKQNANGNCKRPLSTPEEELEQIRTAAFVEVNQRRALAGLPPLEPNKRRTNYVTDLLDGRERDSDDETVGDGVAFGFDHLTLAPRVVLSKAGMAPPAAVTGEGITTFTGLLTGTPPELTYERGIVRLGWSAMMNVMVAILALMIAWIGMSQIIRSFTGNQRGMADWRELIPRLVLAILAAMTSYWWCSLLVDVADGISRYIAATMRVTPADITLTLGQAVLAVIIRSAGSYALSFIPLAGLLALAMKMMMNFLIVTLMLSYTLMLLMMIGQFVLRIVMINLLIILSPLGMIMWALPETAAWGKKWVHEFAVALLTHGLQLVCFALSTWFIREATPVGIVFDTGSFPSALQSLLPTQMIWALALGTMAAYLTTKIPGMLGSSVYEGFQSMFAMAAVGALALTSGGGGGFLGRLTGALGGPGTGGGGAGGLFGTAGGGNLPGVGPLGNVIFAGLSAGSSQSDAIMGGVGRMMMRPITGASSSGAPGSGPGPSSFVEGQLQPTPGTGPAQPSGTVEPSTGVPQEPGSPSAGQNVIPGRETWFPQGQQQQVQQREQRSSDAPSNFQTQHPNPNAQMGTPTLRERPPGMTDAQRVTSVMPRNYQAPAGRALNENYFQPAGGGAPRPTTGLERALVREMGVQGFNQAIGQLGGGGPTSQAVSSQQVVPGTTSQYDTVQQGLGPQRFAEAQQNNLRAIDDNGYMVSESGQIRHGTAAERGIVRAMGMGAFNQVMQGTHPSGHQALGAVQQTETAQPQQPIPRGGLPTYAEYTGIRAGLGGGFEQARQNNVQAIDEYGREVSENGQTRAATPMERHLIEKYGREPFNSVLEGYEPENMYPAQQVVADSGAWTGSQGEPTLYPEGTTGLGKLMNESGMSVEQIGEMGDSGYRALSPTHVSEMVPVTHPVGHPQAGEETMTRQMRVATQQEREIISRVGGPGAFNSALEAGARQRDSAQAGELGEQSQQMDAERGTGFFGQEGLGGRAVQGVVRGVSQARQDFSEGYSETQQAQRASVVVDANTGRVSEETADGLLARSILGRELWNETAAHKVKYEEEGTWIQEGGRWKNIEHDRHGNMSNDRRVYEAFGKDEEGQARYRGILENDTRVHPDGIIDQNTGTPILLHNPTDGDPSDSGYRPATPEETAVIRTVGVEAFNTAGAGVREFHGEGLLVTDDGVRRMGDAQERQLVQPEGQGGIGFDRANAIGQRQVQPDNARVAQEAQERRREATRAMNVSDSGSIRGGGASGTFQGRSAGESASREL